MPRKLQRQTITVMVSAIRLGKISINMTDEALEKVMLTGYYKMNKIHLPTPFYCLATRV
jgi:hypothetical protein